ncbi:hypothetical protein [Thermomonas brevis]
MARLKRRFSPNRIRLGSTNNLPLEGGTSETTLFLVGRELCLFTTLDARQVPMKQRKAFAALAVRRIAPFPDPDFDAAWAVDGSAAIWYWSRARVNALAAEESGKRKRFVAEALHAGRPMDHGVELLSLAEGMEARAWKAGKLHASRWWAHPPTPAQWRDFLRGTGHALQDSEAVPEPVATELAASPWTRQPSNAGALQLSGLDQYLPKAALAAAALLLLTAGAELGSGVRAQIDIWRARSAADRLDAPLKRILAARDAADEASAEITSLLSLHGPRPTTSLMAELTRLMPGGNWQVKRWSQPTPDTLEVSLVAPGSDPEQLVSAWEASPMFKGVTTELGRDNELVVKATITPPPALSGEPAP